MTTDFRRDDKPAMCCYCKWFEPEKDGYQAILRWSGNCGFGWCHRFPPKESNPKKNDGFPRLPWSSFCGEFAPWTPDWWQGKIEVCREKNMDLFDPEIKRFIEHYGMGGEE